MCRLVDNVDTLRQLRVHHGEHIVCGAARRESDTDTLGAMAQAIVQVVSGVLVKR